MIQAYEKELDKIIESLEQELELLLEKRKYVIFTDRINKQITRIKELIAKYKATKEKLQKSPKSKQLLAFIFMVIKRILGLNEIALQELNKSKTPSRTIEKENQATEEEKPEEEEKLSSTISTNKIESKELDKADSSQKQIAIQDPNLRRLALLELSQLNKKNFCITPEVETIHHAPPKEFDPHLIALLQLTKHSENFTQLIEKDQDFAVPTKNKDNFSNLDNFIQKDHEILLKILNEKYHIETDDEKEKKLREAFLYNIKQLYLHHNYLLHHYEHKYNIEEHPVLTPPLLVHSLIKLGVLMYIIERSLEFMARKKKLKRQKDKMEYRLPAEMKFTAGLKPHHDAYKEIIKSHKELKPAEIAAHPIINKGRN
jgi:hypothetical protein